VFRDDAHWLSAVRTIASRHGLDASMRRAPDGSNVVFFVGGRHVVKLFAPFFAEEHRIETEMLELVAGRLGVATPEIMASGLLDDWPYFVLSRVPGTPIRVAWGSLAPEARVRAARELGELAARIHALPTQGLADDWDRTLAALVERCVPRHREIGVPETCLRGVERAVATLLPPTPAQRRVVLHSDLTDEHVLVDGEGHVVGIIDFADAQVGDPLYEWFSLACLARSAPIVPR